MSWTITWGDTSWTDDDLTGQHLATLALISGDDRFEDLSITADEIAVYPGEGFMRLMNLIAALVAVEVSGDLDDDAAQAAVAVALAEIRDASADTILGSVRFD